MDLRVLAQGEGWRVVAKPSGVPVHRSAMVGARDTVMRHARRAFGAEVSPVHRLDQPTSGCLLLSDGPDHTPRLQQALAAGTKRYVVFVRGRVAALDPVVVRSEMLDPDGVAQEAVTTLVPIATSAEPRCSLILAVPETGRWHQIRRHVRDRAHPVLGDSTHGDTRENRFWREQYGLQRLGLHCLSLSLPLPDGGAIEATCPVPDDLAHVLRRMPWWDEACARLPGLVAPEAA
jgi:tRNA pseudouridine65 synthase